jgi:hypothetical protein
MYSCYTDVPATSQGTNVFDASAFVEKQLTSLQRDLPVIHKSIEYNSQKDQLTYTPDSTFWRKELQILADLNINKPTFKELFTVDTVLQEGRQIITYTASTENSEVQNMHLSYMNNALTLIEIDTKTEKNLFNNNRKLTYSIKADKLAAYSIKGSKKVVLTDEVPYHISVDIIR